MRILAYLKRIVDGCPAILPEEAMARETAFPFTMTPPGRSRQLWGLSTIGSGILGPTKSWALDLLDRRCNFC